MAALLQSFSDVFWSPSFWLPGNFTWDVLKNTDNGVYHPQLGDLLVPIYLSVIISILRIIFERYIAKSIGQSFGLKAKVKKATPNLMLENAYKVKRAPSNDAIQDLAKQTELSTREVERWFRIRRNQDRTPVLKKFCESSWRGLFYFIIFWTGLYVHLDKPWFYETLQAWRGWPEHHISDDIYWYYMIELAFYISLIFSLFTDNKRKDFTEMIVHHVATLALMTMSWVNNFVRIGTLVLLVHDAVDSWMEAAKVAKYIGYDKTCEILFFTFMVVWVLTRMIIFPFKIIRSTMFEAIPAMTNDEIPYFSMYGVYNVLLCTLQVLHIIWFYYICLIAKDSFMGQMQGDSRSSMESASDSDGGNAKEKEENITSHAVKAARDGMRSRNGVIKSSHKTAS